MSDVHDVSADRIERLRKEAKRILKRLRAGEASTHQRFAGIRRDPTLRDVQFALARERGFAGWSELVASIEQSTPPAAIDDLERMARDLVTAYTTGEPAAMERHWRDAGHRRSWDGMRRYIQLDLGKRPASDDDPVPITLDDARTLVARGHGYESWGALAEQLAADPPKTTLTTKPIALSKGERHARTRDLDAIDGLIREHGYDTIDVRGQATDALMEVLTRNPTIRSLKLEQSKGLTDAGLRYLARLPDLRVLDLGGSAVGDDGLRVLRDLPRLESLSLWWTHITDAGAEHLGGLDALESIDLAFTRTGDAALRALRNKPNLANVRSGAFVTDAGVAALHDYPVFKEWRGGEPDFELLGYDSGPNSLMLRGSITARALTALVGLDGLFGLNLDDSALALDGSSIAPLAKLPHLARLAFDAKNEAMPYIAALPHLRFLSCQDTPADDDGFVALSESPTIEYIWGRRCHNLRDRGFRALSTMRRLRALSVSCLNVTDAALASLPDFPALRELMPMDVPDASYVHIGRCLALEALFLMYCRETGDEATSHIARLPNVRKYLNTYTRITDQTPELLATMTSLERIELASCPGVTNDGIASLGALPNLTELRLSGMQNVTRTALASLPARIHVGYSPG